MKKIFLMVIFCIFFIGCNWKQDDWEPDFFVAKDVREIRYAGESGIQLEIGYYEANNYKTKQMFKKYTKDTTDYFSLGIDITYFFYNGGNPPRMDLHRTFENNILTVKLSWREDW
jgi:hypothetical protein